MLPDEIWIESLSSAERARLSLAPDERLRLVEVTPSSVLLERRGTGPLPHPAEGPPSLRVDLRTLPLASLLDALHAGGRSGLLHFAHRDHKKWIYLSRGEVVFAASNQRVDRLGECLLRAGVISLAQLREAEQRHAPPERFGKALVERGFLTPRELWNGVKYQVEEIVRSLFAMPGGTVCFWEGEHQPDNVVRLALETRRLVAEGIQRSQELRKFLSVLDDPCVRLARSQGFAATLAGAEQAISNAIGTERSFADVCTALQLDRESAARSVQLLRLVGAIRLTRVPRSENPLGDAIPEQDDQELRAFATALIFAYRNIGCKPRAVAGHGLLCNRLRRNSVFTKACKDFGDVLRLDFQQEDVAGPGAPFGSFNLELIIRPARLLGDHAKFTFSDMAR
jgi:hypothetical protein